MLVFKPKICFVAQDIYGLLRPEIGAFGGAEVQQFLLAKKLKELNYLITFLSYDYGQPHYVSIDGFQLIKTSKREKHIRYMKISNLRRLFLLWKALKEADADIYYVRGCGSHVGIVALFCKLKKKKFIFAIASDVNVDLEHIYKNTKLCERHLYFFGIKNANAIVVQTENQKMNLKDNFRLEGNKINKGIYISNYSFNTNNKEYILWVSSSNCWVKQPQILVELAKRFPKIGFIYLGYAPIDQKIINNRKFPPNIKYHSFLPYPQNLKYYDKAYFLVHASLFEAFPNVFLEAWDKAIPVVSLNVDPDECICKYELGFHSRTFDNMVSHINLLLENENLRAEMGRNGRKYVVDNHDIDKIIYQYVDLFDHSTLKK